VGASSFGFSFFSKFIVSFLSIINSSFFGSCFGFFSSILFSDIFSLFLTSGFFASVSVLGFALTESKRLCFKALFNSSSSIIAIFLFSSSISKDFWIAFCNSSSSSWFKN
jgi:hypothetical protein